MACCALAVFLLVNLLAPFTALRRYMFGEATTINSAVAWRRQDTLPSVATHQAKQEGSRRRRLRIGVLAGQLIVVVGVSAYAIAARTEHINEARVGDWDRLVDLHTAWCRVIGLDTEPKIRVERAQP